VSSRNYSESRSRLVWDTFPGWCNRLAQKPLELQEIWVRVPPPEFVSSLSQAVSVRYVCEHAFVPWTPSYSKNEAELAIAQATTWKDALADLGLAYHGKAIATLRKWADRWSIPTDHLTDHRGVRHIRSRYTEAQAREAVADSFSWAEALRRLGMCHSGGNWRLLKERAEIWGISSEHFDPKARSRESQRKGRIPLEEILVEGSQYSRSSLKDRLYEAGLKERRCELCGQGETWRGMVIGLILDHINGIRDDNRIENLRIVCPNCAAGLETHCGRKNRLEISRECVGCSKVFRPKTPEQRYCSPRCGSRSAGPRGPRPERRKCERPPLDQLLREIDQLGYSAVGRKYGVSDNAIRKWVRTMIGERSDSDSGGQLTLLVPTRTWPNRRRR
jgi:hypothetical protein